MVGSSSAKWEVAAREKRPERFSQNRKQECKFAGEAAQFLIKHPGFAIPPAGAMKQRGVGGSWGVYGEVRYSSIFSSRFVAVSGFWGWCKQPSCLCNAAKPHPKGLPAAGMGHKGTLTALQKVSRAQSREFWHRSMESVRVVWAAFICLNMSHEIIHSVFMP